METSKSWLLLCEKMHLKGVKKFAWQKIRKVDVTENLVAVAGPKVAVVSDKRGSEGWKGSGNPDTLPDRM